jgi:hypothetical protein
VLQFLFDENVNAKLSQAFFSWQTESTAQTVVKTLASGRTWSRSTQNASGVRIA